MTELQTEIYTMHGLKATLMILSGFSSFADGNASGSTVNDSLRKIYAKNINLKVQNTVPSTSI